MKKVTVLCLGLMATMAAGAQVQLVKDAERAMKSGESAAKVAEIIKPAASNPETANDVQVYFIPGKAAFDEYDKLLGLKQFNKLPENGQVTMGQDLINGYMFFMQALPLDSVPDAKGKIKAKHSKDMINALAGHFWDYNGAAVDMWSAQDYKGAYDAWNIFMTLPKNPTVAPKIMNLPADSIMGEISFNRGLAAWQCERLDDALASFDEAKRLGYSKKQLYDYAMGVAKLKNDSETALAWAREAQPIFGHDDATYTGEIINSYITRQDYDGAVAEIQKALKDEPDNSQYYWILGVIYQSKDDLANAKEAYAKALSIDGKNAKALTAYGWILAKEAGDAADAMPATATEADYEKKIYPIYREAASYLERALEINDEDIDTLRTLENVYYNLKDNANTERIATLIKTL